MLRNRPSSRAVAAVALVVAAIVFHRAVRPHLWRVRLRAARLFARFPQRFVPIPAKVLPPPPAEFVGVWDDSPTAVRRQLKQDHGFSQMVRAYLHAYDRDGHTVYELASCAHRPDGITGRWQLHVRLFPTGDGRTDVWAHWELNPNVAPVAHLRQEGYDPDRGERELRELLPEDCWDEHAWSPS